MCLWRGVYGFTIIRIRAVLQYGQYFVPGEKMPSEFETDKNGNIITKPVTGYTIGPVAGMAVLLAIEYVESPAELESGKSKRIQLILTPQQTLEIADVMTRRAKSLLQPASGETRN